MLMKCLVVGPVTVYMELLVAWEFNGNISVVLIVLCKTKDPMGGNNLRLQGRNNRYMGLSSNDSKYRTFSAL